MRAQETTVSMVEYMRRIPGVNSETKGLGMYKIFLLIRIQRQCPDGSKTFHASHPPTERETRYGQAGGATISRRDLPDNVHNVLESTGNRPQQSQEPWI